MMTEHKQIKVPTCNTNNDLTIHWIEEVSVDAFNNWGAEYTKFNLSFWSTSHNGDYITGIKTLLFFFLLSILFFLSQAICYYGLKKKQK